MLRLRPPPYILRIVCVPPIASGLLEHAQIRATPHILLLAALWRQDLLGEAPSRTTFRLLRRKGTSSGRLGVEGGECVESMILS